MLDILIKFSIFIAIGILWRATEPMHISAGALRKSLLALLYYVLLLIDSIVTASTDKSKPWFKRHICDDFPYPAACNDCNRGDCVGCEVLQ